MIEMEGRANTAPASAWRISNARPPDRARLPSRTGSTPPMSAGIPIRYGQHRDLGAEHADALYRSLHPAELGDPENIAAGAPSSRHGSSARPITFVCDPEHSSRVFDNAGMRRLPGADLPDASRGGEQHRRAGGEAVPCRSGPIPRDRISNDSFSAITKTSEDRTSRRAQGRRYLYLRL